MDAVELRNIMYTAQLVLDLPIAIRYPRGRCSMTDWKQPFEKIAIGDVRLLNRGNQIAVLSTGTIGVMVQELIAQEHLDITHMDVRFLKPLNEPAVLEVLNSHEHVITIEDGTVVGGLGSVVGDLAFAKANKPLPQIYKLGIPDAFIEQGPTEDLQRIAGFDREALLKLIKSL
jgi:1-deoxy-D-xylulose-5-phosphate synthase